MFGWIVPTTAAQPAAILIDILAGLLAVTAKDEGLMIPVVAQSA
jgi:hypothetical protein